MKTILNYKCSPHFEQQIKRRRIDPFLVSMCLAEGEMIKLKKHKIKFVLKLEQIKKAVEQEYIKAVDYKGLTSLEVIVRNNILITAYTKLSDIGIYNILAL